MSVVRLDRHGFTASVADDSNLPQLWLPRPARVLSGDETLCELRLVARTLERSSGHTFELTMQPSRTDDNLSFWQALRARRHLYPEMPGSPEFVGRRPGEADAIEEFSEVLFKLKDNNDALFFSEWLEYHFAEIAAHARAASCPADLLDIDRRREDTVVKVAFSYRWSSQAVQRVTIEVCKHIALEAERLFGMSLRYDLLDRLDVREGRLLRDDRLRSASFTSQLRDHSFSSK
jgi:hypothetical protein